MPSEAWIPICGCKPPRALIARLTNSCKVKLHATAKLHGWNSLPWDDELARFELYVSKACAELREPNWFAKARPQDTHVEVRRDSCVHDEAVVNDAVREHWRKMRSYHE